MYFLKRLISPPSTKVIDSSLFLIVCYLDPLDVPDHQTKERLHSFQPLYPQYTLGLLHIELVCYGHGGVYECRKLNKTSVLKYEYEKYIPIAYFYL